MIFSSGGVGRLDSVSPMLRRYNGDGIVAMVVATIRIWRKCTGSARGTGGDGEDDVRWVRGMAGR